MSTPLIPNPHIVLREEFDDWAILFDPDTGNAFGLNPVGVHCWKRMDGRRTLEAILDELPSHFDAVPDNTREGMEAFVTMLKEQGLLMRPN
ncbi:conserved hypothetical protein [Gammaproteobacteria bacterium]